MTNPEQPASQAETEAQALWEASGAKPWQQRTRREHIEANVDDMITDLLYYDRKEDETLPVGAIEEAIKAGEITVEEIIAQFGASTPSLPARLVREFHEVFELPIDDVSRTTNAFRAKLIREEAEEAAEAVEASNRGHLLDRRHVAKELADAVIALYGTAVTMGIDLDKAVALVHASNMSKVDEDGKPIIRADGKVMKGPNYRVPDMSSALRSLRGGDDGTA